MYVLGFGDVLHDSSVCIVKDGEVIAAIELERLTRIKHNLRLNPNAYSIIEQGKSIEETLKKWTVEYREAQLNKGIQYCLELANIVLGEIDCMIGSTLFNVSAFSKQSTFISHHLAHSASVFYPSNFDESAILTIDGYGFVDKLGNSDCVMFSHGKGNAIQVIDSIEGRHNFTREEIAQGATGSHIVFSNSIGVFYQNISMLLGMGYQGEGKTMGLSAYGQQDEQFNKIKDHINFLDNGKIEINNREIFSLVSNLLCLAERQLSTKDFFQYKANLAYTHQCFLEEMIVYLCKHLYKLTESKNLCLAGGVALNSVANGKIIQNTPFENIFIQPAAGDSGISLGCALHESHAVKNISRHYLTKNIIFSPYLGKNYNDDFAHQKEYSMLEKACTHIVNDNVIHEVAKLISEEKIVGWFDGRSEIGPRALGARCILADPRHKEMKDILNNKIKHRESFRPFAPAILEEAAVKYFEGIFFSPYMLLVAIAKSIATLIIPAVIHVNNTARLQTVNKELSPNFYRLIKEYEGITGVSAILNTSFNIAGEPIVETPADAIKCFLNTSMDALYINGNLYLKIYTITGKSQNVGERIMSSVEG